MRTSAKFVPLIGLAAACAAAWAYLLIGGTTLVMNVMTMPDGGPMRMPADPAPASGARILAMWIVMMVAMMVPGAMPVAARFAAPAPMLRFAAAYVGAWVLFALAATLAQWGLSAAGLLTGEMAVGNATLAGVVLVAIGLYQFSPWIARDLERCRTGARYTVSCLRCCAPLMLVLFVVGVMNVVWWIVVSGWVLAEKRVPNGFWLARASGAALVIWGLIRL